MEDEKEETRTEENREEEPRRRSGYYINQPVFGKNRTSWVKQQFGRSIAIFLAVAACIFLYFLLL